MRGAGPGPNDILYSSAADAGVRSSANLMEVVRREAGISQLVFALMTPTCLTRPVRIAELGAARARDVLFPTLAPGMSRSELDGILPELRI